VDTAWRESTSGIISLHSWNLRWSGRFELNESGAFGDPISVMVRELIPIEAEFLLALDLHDPRILNHDLDRTIIDASDAAQDLQNSCGIL
jgi:hypothetical protein